VVCSLSPAGAFLLRLVTAVLTKISEERKTEKIYLRKEVALSSFSFFLCRCMFEIAPPVPSNAVSYVLGRILEHKCH